jgi:hypothetical protein
MATNQNPEQQKKENALWTIILYIAADGILANFAVESLKQVNRSVAIPYGGKDEGRVIVTAQFAIDAPGGQQIPRYIFNETTGGSIGNGFKEYLDAPYGMTEQEALMSFLQWVFKQKECAADHYVLILWGHGPELLLQSSAADQLSNPTGNPQNPSAENGADDLYLTPEDLRVALEQGLPKGKKLDIIAFDACSMSMFEMADEIKDLADYIVASQEEVPDSSFPYDELVGLFRRKGANTESLIKKGVREYVAAYQDYITNNITGMKSVMLSAFRLNHCVPPLRCAIHHLACALYLAKRLPCLPGLLMQARSCSREFVAGLYVDLKDFCTKLDRILSVGAPDKDDEYQETNASTVMKYRIRKACGEVIKALPDTPTNNSFILVNSSNDPDCHGVSLYFPYLSDEQYAQIAQPMVKGGRDTTKGLSSVVNQAATALLMSNRRDLIVVTESYYENLKFAVETGWYYFIAKQWSAILAQMAPDQLDFFYSAQQCAVNFLKDVDIEADSSSTAEESNKKEAGQSEKENLTVINSR